MLFDLIEVIPSNEDHTKYLFDLLKKKTFSISHKKLPDFEDHRKFVKNHPYRKWYLLKFNSDFIGSVYLTNTNIIGLNLLSNDIKDYVEVIKLIVKSHKPLAPINSERSKYFLINANPNNLNLINALKFLKMNHIQNTYAYVDKN